MIKFLRKHSNTFVSKWLVLLIDLLVVSASFMVATFVRFNFDLDYIEPGVFRIHLFLAVLFRLVSFLIFNSYSGIVRHTSLEDVNILLKATFSSSMALAFMSSMELTFFGKPLDIPYSILLIDFFIASFTLVLIRFVVKMIYDKLISSYKAEKQVLIYGAGHLGRVTKNSLSSDKRLKYNILGFIDDNPHLVGKSVEGIGVYKMERARERFLNPTYAHFESLEIIFAIQSISNYRKTQIVDELLELGVPLKILPPISQWMDGKLQAKQIHNIRIEDLLQREPIKLNNMLVSEYLGGKVIMVTGAAGSIGSELVRQIAKFQPKELILVDQAESALYDIETELRRLKDANNGFKLSVLIRNVCNKQRMSEAFVQFKPEVVFHAAAYKHVPLMESDPFKSVEVNVFGTKAMADLSLEYGVSRFVFISTDKAVNPTNIMGATKRLAEMYVQSLNVQQNQTRFITTRFGNVLGSNGSVIPLFKRQIQNGGPVTVTHEKIIRYFMTIPEACQLVLEAGTMGKGGEIFVFEMGEPVKILDLANRMIRLSGFEPGVNMKIEFTGLRPGEKLFEELLSDKESTGPTHHPKIMIARVRPEPIDFLRVEMEAFEKGLERMKNEEIVHALKKLIPEYISNNSPYSKLDAPKKVS
ncbi:polysaccharide biosynthesis protein [Marinilongibacter aquaticus]|uniref:polysaccharide biosynthesis protein n=1 Tax=Marinilongibacter aquaticus TaxID=2975157 RepID=UPI0021BDB588|nr:nucleoside-diphosphate sugar epimerase/dehydratase [Marinilongibacter aquaticus]UBM57651.1 polysaccharide biosynthesis protein [Marinilongibacter aquaticus]